MLGLYPEYNTFGTKDSKLEDVDIKVRNRDPEVRPEKESEKGTALDNGYDAHQGRKGCADLTLKNDDKIVRKN
ncbi:hypothetical protein CEXT_118221 [Caerostris extrusa]|uniref:Uncharacterized protein n=1 Tax=Caerostris extrusa TaxID=172846 RepID=A0AAV4UKW7_CAEEX|nr:hypothetical protein CEXT_118221 [Caerostris extrusa]